jgi:tetratricopeptide (TPR) repeat protein
MAAAYWPQPESSVLRLVIALLLACATTTVAAADSTVVSLAYKSLVERYAHGDREAAVREVAGWSRDRLRSELAPILGTEPGAQPAGTSRRWTTAALMLHTDAAWRGASCRGPEGDQMRAALACLRLAPRDATNVVAGWYHANALKAVWSGCPKEALDWAKAGLFAVPRDVDLLAAQAVAEERVVASVHGEPMPQERAALERAARVLGAALVLAPARQDIRNRLGHVSERLGRWAEAQAAFQAVLASGPDPEAAHFAHLGLGRLDEDQRHVADAARHYREAVRGFPTCQSARIALAHALYELGDALGAKAAVEASLVAAPRGGRVDVCWRYPSGDADRAELFLADLREQASQ